MSSPSNPNSSPFIPLRGVSSQSRQRPSLAQQRSIDPDRAYSPNNGDILAHQNIISRWMYETHDERELRYVDSLLKRNKTKQEAFQHWLAAGKAARVGELDYVLHEHILGRLLRESRMDNMTTKELVEVGKFVATVMKEDLSYHDKVLHGSAKEIPSLLEQGVNAKTVFAEDDPEVIDAMTQFEALDTLERERLRNVFSVLINELEEE